METYDVLVDFKARADELLDMKNEYFGGTYIMNLTKEAGLGVIKKSTGDGMMSILAESVAILTPRALAVAFIGVELGAGSKGLLIRDKALLLLYVDSSGKFHAWKRRLHSENSMGPYAGPWIELEDDFNEGREPGIMEDIFRDSSFDLSAAEAVPGRILAGVTII